MRILWVSNAPWGGSGYAEQTALFVRRLRDMGHDIAVAANWGSHGAKLTWEGFPVYPSDNAWCNTNLPTYVADHQAELVIALCDAWVLKPNEWPQDLPPVAVWAPVDHDPLPPPVLDVLSHHLIRPIAMSRFGEAAMKDRGLDACYVPHAADLSVFKPDTDVRRQMRDQLGIPQDAFVAGMVAANRSNPLVTRKSFPQAFDAYARFAAAHDDAWLYVHTDPVPKGGGIDLAVLAEATGCPPERTRFTPPQAWHLPSPNSLVAALHNTFDVLLSPSMGEGFGVPILEAQACGIPVIVSDHSAMPELCAAGTIVGGDRWWDPLQQSWYINPSIAQIHGALELAWQNRGSDKLRDAAVAFAAGYDADQVAAEFWAPTLDKLTSAREVPPLAVPVPNRAARRAARKQKVAA